MNVINFPDDKLARLMRPDTGFDDRKALLLEALTAAWQRGWDECAEAFQEAFDQIPLAPGRDQVDAVIKRIRHN